MGLVRLHCPPISCHLPPSALTVTQGLRSRRLRPAESRGFLRLAPQQKSFLKNSDIRLLLAVATPKRGFQRATARPAAR